MSLEKMLLVQKDIQALIQIEAIIDSESYVGDEFVNWLQVFQQTKQKMDYLTNNCAEELQKYLLFCNDTVDNYNAKVQKIQDVINELSS